MFVRRFTFITILLFLNIFSANLLLASEATENKKVLKNIIVKLNDIKVEKTASKNGDEIYFSITEYSSLNRSKENRVPIQPTHWLSQNASRIKDVIMWQGGIQEGEEIRLIISLLEHDAPPVDPDDLIGSAEIIINNKQGNISKKWKTPIFEETSEVEMMTKTSPQTLEEPLEQEASAKPQQFIFKGENARYIVSFDVKTQ